VSHIKKSGERMLSIINDIMDISKIESNTINLKVSEIVVNDLVSNILDVFEGEADEKGIKLIYDKPKNLDQLLINSDRIKIEQVLSNLIKNALKFTEKGFVKTGYYTENNSVVFM
jgi:signal transduction histidine kinase